MLKLLSLTLCYIRNVINENFFLFVIHFLKSRPLSPLGVNAYVKNISW